MRTKSSKQKPKQSRQPRKALTETDLVKIALSRFSGDPFKSVEEIGRLFDRQPATVSRAITKAFKEHLVKVVPANREDQRGPARIPELENLLRERFHQISTCIVIETAHRVPSLEEDDEVHRDLGKAIASLIASGSLFRDNDVIGLGSGRGVYYAIQALASAPPLRASVTLVSLTGAVYARDYSEQINLLLDADVHLGLLGPQFGTPVTIHPISHPIAYSDPTQLSEVIAKSPLGEDQWKARPATHALVGVGVLSKGHRFYKEVTAKENRTTILNPIYERLGKLVERCEAIEKKFGYCPVADICNRLFYLPPPRGTRLSKHELENVEQVKPLLDEINGCLLTIPKSKLRQIQTIILVAGTSRKASAIAQLLGDGYPIRFLCTDRRAAEEILRVSAK